jgi:hypothetical protein
MLQAVILSPYFGRMTPVFRGGLVNSVNSGGSSPKVRAQNDSPGGFFRSLFSLAPPAAPKSVNAG